MTWYVVAAGVFALSAVIRVLAVRLIRIEDEDR